MATAQARVLWNRRQQRVQVHDINGRARWNELWEHNPIMARPGSQSNIQVLVNGPGARPYIAGKTSERWTWKQWDIRPGEVHLTEQEKRWARKYPNRIIIEPNIKINASPNKDWGWLRWIAFAHEAQKAGVKVTQIGPSHVRRLPRAEFIQTAGIRQAAALMSMARAAVLTEGALHHLAAAFNIPAVVIFGGYISPDITGYEMHHNIFTGGVACGSRMPCDHCARAMSEITVGNVLVQLMALLNAKT
jgi:ADP-heptose:LPS heptosyltransferase